LKIPSERFFERVGGRHTSPPGGVKFTLEVEPEPGGEPQLD